MSRQILNGWKEISGYIHRGVRTAQRWETGRGLPVHRPALKDRNAVVAFSDELDAWISPGFPDPNPVHQLQANMNSLAWRTAELASQTRILQEQLRRSLETHKNRIALRIRTRTLAPANRTMGVMLPFRKSPKSRATPGNGYLG